MLAVARCSQGSDFAQNKVLKTLIKNIVNQVEELQHGLEEQERSAVEAASQFERQQFLSLARALQPVLEQQAVLACNHLASTSNLSDLITSLTDMTEERKTATAELDSMIRWVQVERAAKSTVDQGPAKRCTRLQLHNPTTFPSHLLARVEAWIHLFHRQRLLSAEAVPLQSRHLPLPTSVQAQASLAKKPVTCLR